MKKFRVTLKIETDARTNFIGADLTVSFSIDDEENTTDALCKAICIAEVMLSPNQPVEVTDITRLQS